MFFKKYKQIGSTALLLAAFLGCGESDLACAGQGHVSTAKQSVTKSVAKTQSTLPLRRFIPGAKEFFWKISSNEGAILYLLGSIHLVKADFYPIPDEIEKALLNSKALMVEIDISKTDKAAMQSLIMQKGIYPTATFGLDSEISPELYSKLTEYCRKNNLAMANINRMKPWMISLTIMQTELQKLGYDPKQGIDLYLIQKAKLAGKKVISLESEESQISLFSSWNREIQEKMLAITLLDISKMSSDVIKIVKAWKDGDPSAMEAVVQEDEKKYPELMPVQEKLIYERNITMAEKLQAYLKGTDSFFCTVGSAHLVGERGILAILKNKGYKIEQICVGEKI